MNAPGPKDKEVDTCMFMDSNHAGDKASCRLRSGFLIYVNITLVQRFSKKQSTVESSIFDAKLSQ